MKHILNSILSVWLPPKILYYINEIRSHRKYLPFKNLLKKNSRLRSAHSKQRCFILGSGNSIKDHDLSLLKDDVVIALNNFARHPQFNLLSNSTKKRYYLIAPIHPPQSDQEWEKWLRSIYSTIKGKWNLFLGLSSYPHNSFELNKKFSIWDRDEVYWFFAGNNWSPLMPATYSPNFTNSIMGGRTASVYALQLAIYLGFKDIYLLGMDHDTILHTDPSKMRFYSTSEHQVDERNRVYGNNFYIDAYHNMYNTFKTYKYLSDSHPEIKIWNASEGGLLKVFPRVEYKSLF